VTRRPARRREEEGERRDEAHAPLAAPRAPATLLDLQRSAGNAAVARVLAREPDTAAPPLQLTSPGPVVGGPNPFIGPYKPPELEPAVEQAVDNWLTDQKTGIEIQVGQGATSIPEVIDAVRRHVPAAASAKPEAIRARIDRIIGAVPGTRGKRDLAGQRAEQQSRISNLFPTPPTSVTFGGSKTSVRVGIHGAELKTRAAETGIEGKADQEGAEAEIKKGGAKVGASGKWDGNEFALKTEVGPLRFGTKVHRKGQAWAWTGGLTIQLSGEEADELPDVAGAVLGAHAAIAESLGHLQSGGALDDGFVKERMGKVKPAFGALGDVAKRTKPGVTLRVNVGDEDGGFTAGVSLVVVF
jgi:hypothetical protein